MDRIYSVILFMVVFVLLIAMLNMFGTKDVKKDLVEGVLAYDIISH